MLITSCWWLLGVFRLLATDYFVSPTGTESGLVTNHPAPLSVSDLNLNWLGSTNSDRTNITIYFYPGNYFYFVRPSMVATKQSLHG